MKSTLVATSILIGMLVSTSSLSAAPRNAKAVSPNYNFSVAWIGGAIPGDLTLEGESSGNFTLNLEFNPSFCGTWKLMASTLIAEGTDCQDPNDHITFQGWVFAGGSTMTGSIQIMAQDYSMASYFSAHAPR